MAMTVTAIMGTNWGDEGKGKMTEEFPEPPALDRARPIYKRLPGWRCNISEIKAFDHLPKNAQAYVLRVEELIRTPVKWISVGPRREAMITKHEEAP